MILSQLSRAHLLVGASALLRGSTPGVLLRASTVVMLLLASTVVAGQAAGQEPPFGPGELCEFSIDYGVINAGGSTLEVRDMIDYDGQRCYHIRTRARSNRFFSAAYRVRDQADSFMDADSLFTRYWNKHLREGDFRREVEIHFDHTAEKAYYSDGGENDIVAGVHDILTAFFWVRAQELIPGSVLELPTYGDKEMYALKVKVHRIETIGSKPFGDVECVVVQPFLEGEGLFKHEGDLLIWLTNDPRHVPVKITANVPVGSISATLKKYRPPKRQKSED